MCKQLFGGGVLGEGGGMKAFPILEVSQLTKDFGGVRAANQVSFDLRDGESLGIIGPNGSGKTTLANLISGFVRPDQGSVRFKGKEITGMMPHRIAQLGLRGPSRWHVRFTIFLRTRTWSFPSSLHGSEDSPAGNMGIGMPPPSIFWKRWVLRGTPLSLSNLPVFCPMVISNASNWPVAWP